MYIGRDAKSDPKYLGSGIFLKKAIKKYGKQNFLKIIIEKLTENSTKLELIEREYFWLKIFNVSEDKNFYNISMNNGGMGINDKHTEETKKIISERTREAMLKPEFVKAQRERVSKSSSGRKPYNKGIKIGKRTKDRKKNKKFTKEEIIEIRNLYNIGKSASGLSKIYNCSHHTITKIVKRIKPYNE